MGELRKQYLELAGEPVLLRAVRPFLRRRDVVQVVVALPREDLDEPPDWLVGADDRVRVVAGGATRGESVRAALGALMDAARLVAVHDGARPLLNPRTLERCLRTAREEGGGAVAGWPAVDTLKEVDADGWVLGPPPRASLWHAQTPQVFPRALIVEAYEAATPEELAATDDATLVEKRGGRVRMVRASPWNLKVTRPADMEVAETLLRRRMK